MEINKFRIKKLHKSLNYELCFTDNTLILLGENGSCKTTILKMLYYTLSLQWLKLAQYNFESIEIDIDNQTYIIRKDDIILTEPRLNNRLFRILPHPIRYYLLSINEEGNSIDYERLRDLCMTYNFPFEVIMHELNVDENIDINRRQKVKIKFQESIEKFKKIMEGINILYLPTYRRIEQDLKVVLEGRIDEDEFRENRIKRIRDTTSYTELIEFGMRDVESAIQESLISLKDFSRSSLNQLTLGYLGDIVNKTYLTNTPTNIEYIEETTINDIMNRVEESILSKDSKEKLIKTLQEIKEREIYTDHDKVVSHYFLKLYESHKQLIDKEMNIRDFVEICTKYLENKIMVYDSPNFTFDIKLRDSGDTIKLQQLSSGEKQIVSLFSHLYLSNKRNYIVLIDEPELSLSVKWQKIFLEDVHNGEFCRGLIAVTHSPFIFDNTLDRYAHGIEEFKI